MHPLLPTVTTTPTHRSQHQQLQAGLTLALLVVALHPVRLLLLMHRPLPQLLLQTALQQEQEG